MSSAESIASDSTALGDQGTGLAESGTDDSTILTMDGQLQRPLQDTPRETAMPRMETTPEQGCGKVDRLGGSLVSVFFQTPPILYEVDK